MPKSPDCFSLSRLNARPHCLFFWQLETSLLGIQRVVNLLLVMMVNARALARAYWPVLGHLHHPPPPAHTSRIIIATPLANFDTLVLDKDNRTTRMDGDIEDNNGTPSQPWITTRIGY